MLNAEKEKQRLLEERWALSVNRKATSEAEGAGNTVRRGSFKGVIDGSKAVFLFDDGVSKLLSQQIPSRNGDLLQQNRTTNTHIIPVRIRKLALP